MWKKREDGYRMNRNRTFVSDSTPKHTSIKYTLHQSPLSLLRFSLSFFSVIVLRKSMIPTVSASRVGLPKFGSAKVRGASDIFPEPRLLPFYVHSWRTNSSPRKSLQHRRECVLTGGVEVDLSLNSDSLLLCKEDFLKWFGSLSCRPRIP